ncbi:MAG: protein-L-isoaspartate(D-aspartate) O-methyltransferase [Deltaproteobacteria bacterium]|nr:protein-L-isoaspartate(D-aspartate) O-methyltransferase [Deltaproteobacteria bacterium]
MVAEQLEARDITDPRVLQAMRRVPRHLFVPEPLRDQAFGDHPLPIGHQQTISQPYIVASMTQALEIQPGHRVLEIGTGSGYQAAVLAELGAQVFSIEIVAPLAARARETLASLGLDGIRLRTGDGWAGWPEEAPFDRIMLTAAPEDVPPPLLEQLAPGGLLIAPLGRGTQDLVLVRRTETGWERKVLYGVRFVPMTGRARNDPAPAPEP